MIEGDIEYLRHLVPELKTGAEELAEDAATVQRTMTETAHREFIRKVIKHCERVTMIGDFTQTSLEMMLDQLATDEM